MEKQKWENLSTDCLVNIFGRLPVESLILDVQLVCKPWHQALQNPFCWRRIVFPLTIRYPHPEKFMRETIIRSIIKRSQRAATELVLPPECTTEELIYFSDECPALKVLAVPRSTCETHGLVISRLIMKWKNLELIKLGSSSYMTEILTQISLHCKNFVGLCALTRHGLYCRSVCISIRIDEEKALAIVSELPNLKHLILQEVHLPTESLKIILQGCEELVQLHIQNCFGFDRGDEEIQMLCFQIKNFHLDDQDINIEEDYYGEVCPVDYSPENPYA